jgi:hypothetical protein
VKILVSGDSRCFQVIPDDGNWDFIVGGNDNWSDDSTFTIGPVAAFLADEAEAGGEKDSF